MCSRKVPGVPLRCLKSSKGPSKKLVQIVLGWNSKKASNLDPRDSVRRCFAYTGTPFTLFHSTLKKSAKPAPGVTLQRYEGFQSARVIRGNNPRKSTLGGDPGLCTVAVPSCSDKHPKMTSERLPWDPKIYKKNTVSIQK